MGGFFAFAGKFNESIDFRVLLYLWTLCSFIPEHIVVRTAAQRRCKTRPQIRYGP